jgi:hypothetical protein
VPVDAAPPGNDVTVNDGDDVSSGSDGDADTRPDEAAPPQETGGNDSGCNGLGCSCTGPADCVSVMGLCSDKQSLTPGLYAQNGGVNFCTRPCCTSADCDANTVCYATAAGGNYCVKPAWLPGRSTSLGSAIGGASCTSNSQCRSGLCAGNTCADTCCSTNGSSTECAAGNYCRFTNFPGTAKPDQNFSANCGPSPGTRPNASMCNGNTDCRSELCASDTSFSNAYCHNACRGSSDCGSQGACAYVGDSGNVLAACVLSNGNLQDGQSCNPMNDTCQTGFCSSSSLQCTDVCFSDADCTKSGWHCRPESLTVIVMGSPAGTYSVLACGS